MEAIGLDKLIRPENELTTEKTYIKKRMNLFMCVKCDMICAETTPMPDPLFTNPLFADKSETKNETKRDESDPTPSEEERQELEQDLIEIALETTRRNYTFVYASPSKKLFEKCQSPFNRQ